jgi:hypothetical protein
LAASAALPNCRAARSEMTVRLTSTAITIATTTKAYQTGSTVGSAEPTSTDST